MPPSLQLKPTDSDPLTGVESQASTTYLHAEIDEPHLKQSTSIVTLHYRCYVLHGFLLIIQTVLLAMLCSHPEHNVTIAFDNSVLTIGLSAFLQAFYTVSDTRGTTPHFSQRLQLYTALLVFVTQRLALIDLISRPQKLTATHDVSGAWSGLGAAIATLWQQTNVAASTRATLLVFLYLSCISILHVASPTIMEFQAYNATSTMTVPSNTTSPDLSINLTILDMATTAPLVPLVFNNLTGLSTDGLINSTLYDTFPKTPQMVNASVNAKTIQANCGLLSNLTYTSYQDVVENISASMSGIGEVNFVVESQSEGLVVK